MNSSWTPAQYNGYAIEARAAGRSEEALRTFAEGVERFPQVHALRANYAHALYESGATARAAQEYERLLELDPDSLAARFALFELLQILGRRDEALAHQLEALARQSLFSSIAPREQRRLLLLCTPGDLQANVPVDFVIDRETTTVHRLFLLDRETSLAQELPPFDIVWNVIAESPTSHRALDLADEFARAQRHIAFLNRAARVRATAREALAETLAQSGAFVAPVARLERAAFLDASAPFGYPSIVRPVGSHAGKGLQRLDADAQRAGYVQEVDASEYYVSPFVEYRSDDGYYRKYRIIFVDGEPYPCHLAISDRWMIHYYNAGMTEHAWRRDEEERFLADMWSVFGAHRETLRNIASEVGLEYFGIDATIAQDGRVFVFEADPAMVVHTGDSPELFPYKQRYVPAIFRAVERMLDGRIAADT